MRGNLSLLSSSPVPSQHLYFVQLSPCASPHSRRLHTLTETLSASRTLSLHSPRWSVGIMLYQLYARRFPYWATYEQCRSARLEEVAALAQVGGPPKNKVSTMSC
jgi:hypothetical protein